MKKFLGLMGLCLGAAFSPFVGAEVSMNDVEERHNIFLDQFYNGKEVNPFSYYTQYRDNQFAADKKFKGQWIIFEGNVSRVVSDRAGAPVVELVGAPGMNGSVMLHLYPQQITTHDKSGYHYVSAENVVEGLSAKQPLVAHCRGIGKVDGDPSADSCLIYSLYTYKHVYGDN